MTKLFALLVPALLVASMTGLPAIAQEAEALDLINAQRQKKGCDPLTIHPQLQAAAEQHARNMGKSDFFSHTGADGSEFDERINAQGYSGRAMAENIAAGQQTAASVVSSWMDSPGHRRNIMNCRYTDTGLAVYHQTNDQPIEGNSVALHYYWVQTFGRP